MLDLRLIREEKERVAAALARRGDDPAVLDRVLDLDARRRATQAQMDERRAEQKRLSKDVPQLSGGERVETLARLKTLSDDVAAVEKEQASLAAELNALMLDIPNVPDPTAPEGAGDDANVELRRWGLPQAFEFPVRDHVEIGASLGIIDVERGARTSGSRFYYLKGAAVLLELALVRYALDRLQQEGFTPVLPPVLVRREAMEGTGFLPTDEAQIYRTADDDLYLVGTSEVPLAALHMGETLNAGDLPLRYAGISTCFRREAGTYGKDTRGIFRVHQFDKVEMFSFTTPDTSSDEHEFLLQIEEWLLQGLELPYRVVNIAAGELGASAAKKYDCEAWLPGQADYRELTSCSNCTDYQARRLNCRFKGDGNPAFVHTLNGTAISTARWLIALLETHQRADGGVTIPAALRPFFGADHIAPPK
ncbi:MAG: serine--tRNA ligase [Actinomycetota bacterium]|nr:serine--tRNA ligase [Actinomycetota bacterium]